MKQLGILAALVCISCGNQNSSDSKNSQCPHPNDTSIHGVLNEQSTVLDPPGGHNSQVHLQTVDQNHGLHTLTWHVAANRQTCDQGAISENKYLQISYNPTMYHMRVVPGKNYIDYTVTGCDFFDNCGIVAERGTIVLNVTYIK